MRKEVDTAAPEKKVVAQTKFGKDIEIARCPGRRGFTISILGGSPMPADLDGVWYPYSEAENAVAAYVRKTKAKPFVKPATTE